MIFQEIHNMFKNINKKILKIMKCGLQFSFILCLVATAILCIYLFFYQDSFLYQLGFNSLKIGIIIGIEFIICGLAVDSIKSYGL